MSEKIESTATTDTTATTTEVKITTAKPAKSVQYGLKSCKRPGATRRDEWNRPNDKASKRLAWRTKEWERSPESAGGHKHHKPGSMKCY